MLPTPPNPKPPPLHVDAVNQTLGFVHEQQALLTTEPLQSNSSSLIGRCDIPMHLWETAWDI